MRIFLYTSKNDAIYWYDGFGRKEISSIADFFKKFLYHWHDEEEGKIKKAIEDVIALLPNRAHFGSKELNKHAVEEAHEEVQESMKKIRNPLLKISLKSLLMFPLKYMLNI